MYNYSRLGNKICKRLKVEFLCTLKIYSKLLLIFFLFHTTGFFLFKHAKMCACMYSAHLCMCDMCVYLNWDLTTL